MNLYSFRSHSRSPISSRRRQSPAPPGGHPPASGASRGRRDRRRSRSGSSYSSSSTSRSSYSRSYSRSYSSYSRSLSGSSSSSYTSTSSSSSGGGRGPRSSRRGGRHSRSRSPIHGLRGSRSPSASRRPRGRRARRLPQPPPGSPPPTQVQVKQTTRKLITKTTVTRGVPGASVGKVRIKTRLKKEGDPPRGSKKSMRNSGSSMDLISSTNVVPQEPPVSPKDFYDPGGTQGSIGVPEDPMSYSPASPRLAHGPGGHLLDPHHYKVVPPSHPEYHQGPPQSGAGGRTTGTGAAGEEYSSSSGTSEDEDDVPRRMTLSERFGKLAQLSSQRQEYDGVRMKIVREGGQDKKVFLEDGHLIADSSRSPSPPALGPGGGTSRHHHRHSRRRGVDPASSGAHERWLKEHQSEFVEYQQRYGEIRNWDPHRDLPLELPPNWDDLHVRYRYYKESGYFGDRNITLDDYIKWESWWYRYRDWLEKYGDVQASQSGVKLSSGGGSDWQYSSGGGDSRGYDFEPRRGSVVVTGGGGTSNGGGQRWSGRENSSRDGDEGKKRRRF